MTVGLLDIHAEQSTILIINTCNKKKGKTCVFIWLPGHDEGIELEITTEGGGGGKGGHEVRNGGPCVAIKAQFGSFNRIDIFPQIAIGGRRHRLDNISLEN